jgi:hypothetical protein
MKAKIVYQDRFTGSTNVLVQYGGRNVVGWVSYSKQEDPFKKLGGLGIVAYWRLKQSKSITDE